MAAGNLGRHRVRMHTYFEPPANTHWTFGSDALAKAHWSNGSDALELWRELWQAAGYEPHVLSEADARNHPQYASLRQRWATLPTVNSRHYELSCFMRYAAMAATGGGWMVDYDVLPLRSHRQSAWATEEAADGKFTAFQSHVPALLHGAASEWDRVAQLLSSVPWQRNPEHFSHNGRPHVSDMHALAYYIGKGKIRSTHCGVVSAEQLFSGAGHTLRRRIVNPQHGNGSTLDCSAAARSDCRDRGALPLAVHLSHASIREGLQQVRLPMRYNWATLASRSAFERELLSGWRKHCHSRQSRGESSVPLAEALPGLLVNAELTQNGQHCHSDCRTHLGERCPFCGRDGACCRLGGTGRGTSKSNQTRACEYGLVGCRGYHCCVLAQDADRVSHFRRRK